MARCCNAATSHVRRAFDDDLVSAFRGSADAAPCADERGATDEGRLHGELIGGVGAVPRSRNEILAMGEAAAIDTSLSMDRSWRNLDIKLFERRHHRFMDSLVAFLDVGMDDFVCLKALRS